MISVYKFLSLPRCLTFHLDESFAIPAYVLV